MTCDLNQRKILSKHNFSTVMTVIPNLKYTFFTRSPRDTNLCMWGTSVDACLMSCSESRSLWPILWYLTLIKGKNLVCSITHWYGTMDCLPCLRNWPVQGCSEHWITPTSKLYILGLYLIVENNIPYSHKTGINWF